MRAPENEKTISEENGPMTDQRIYRGGTQFHHHPPFGDEHAEPKLHDGFWRHYHDEGGMVAVDDAEGAEVIPAGPVRSAVVGLAGTISHARKYTWAERPEVADLLARLDRLVDELVAQLPENQDDPEDDEAQAEGLAAADLDPDWPGHGDER